MRNLFLRLCTRDPLPRLRLTRATPHRNPASNYRFVGRFAVYVPAFGLFIAFIIERSCGKEVQGAEGRFQICPDCIADARRFRAIRTPPSWSWRSRRRASSLRRNAASLQTTRTESCPYGANLIFRLQQTGVRAIAPRDQTKNILVRGLFSFLAECVGLRRASLCRRIMFHEPNFDPSRHFGQVPPRLV
jgi:hypothetical protein